jgi:hypothetical protein
MAQQVDPKLFVLMPSTSDAMATAENTTLHLGPPQKLTLLSCLRFFRKGPPLVIPEPLKPLWYTKGWRQAEDGKSFKGRYAAEGQTWRGMIQEPYKNGFIVYIWRPPITEIRRNTSHGPCFMPSGENERYQVHFRNAPKSLDHAITCIETVLAQACRHNR